MRSIIVIRDGRHGLSTRASVMHTILRIRFLLPRIRFLLPRVRFTLLRIRFLLPRVRFTLLRVRFTLLIWFILLVTHAVNLPVSVNVKLPDVRAFARGLEENSRTLILLSN